MVGYYKPANAKLANGEIVQPNGMRFDDNRNVADAQTMSTSPRRGQNEMVRSSSVPAETPRRERPS